MQGSLYPDGVTVDHVALSRTELTKAAEILLNRREWTSRGILSGGTVLVNGSPAPTPWVTININPFSGFTPNGEFIECPIPYGAVGLSSTDSGVVNYVGAVYTENNTHSQPHESDGNTYPIFSEMAWRIRVYTEAEYNLLPVSDDNLANDSQDRFLLIAKVTARGSSENLISSRDIELPLDFNNLLYTAPIDLTQITGLRVTGVSPGTPTGVGTISYTYVASPLSYTFTWQPNGAATPGTPVAATTDGTIQLKDSGGVEYLNLDFSAALMPLASVDEDINVLNLYNQDVPRVTGEDSMHRNMQGTGVPTPRNPHALSIDDLSGQNLSILDEHQNLMHCNGINRISKAACLSVGINELQPITDHLEVIAPSGNDAYYVNGKKLTYVTPMPSDIYFQTPAVESSYYYEIYVTDEGSLEYSGSLTSNLNQQAKAAYPENRECTGTQIVNMSDDYPAGSYDLLVSTSGFVSNWVWRVSWDGGDEVVLVSADDSQVIRLYDSSGVRWIDLWFRTNGDVQGDEYATQVTATDTITVRASYTEGTDTYMKIAGVNYWYNPSGRWIMGYDPLGGGKSLVDHRIWGNTGPDQISTEMLEDMFYEPLNTQGRSGCLMRRTAQYSPFSVEDIGGGSVRVKGGVYYIRGKRVVVTDSVDMVLSPNTDYLIWADDSGSYHSKIVTGSTADEMLYILGDPYDREDISDVYHASMNAHAPERGVILAYVSRGASSDINYIDDFTQNINQVDNNWSVGSRNQGATSNGFSQCAYDNLHAAFSYWSYATYGTTNRGGRNISIEGLVYLPRTVTQPEGCIVVGGARQYADDSSDNFVGVVCEHESIYPVPWELSKRCKVLNVSLYHIALQGTAGAAAIKVDDDCEVSGCRYFSHVSGIDFLTWADTSTGVKVTNNTVKGGLFNAPLGLAGFTAAYFTVTGNWITAARDSLGADASNAIVLRGVDNSVISNNIVVVQDIGGSMNGIVLSRCAECTVIGNDVSLSNSSPSSSTTRGIWITESNDITLSGNIIKRGDSNLCAIGISLFDTYQVIVDSNLISYMAGGVVSQSGARNISVTNNNFNQIGSRAVSIQLGQDQQSWGIRVDKNNIINSGSGANGGTAEVPPNPNSFIYMYGDPHNENSIIDVSICGNMIQDCTSSASLFVIELAIQGSNTRHAKGVKICDNIIQDVTGQSTYLRGIHIEGEPVPGQANIQQLDISGNQMQFRLNDRPDNGSNANCCIRVLSTVSDCKIQDNQLRMYDSAAVYDMGGVGIAVGTTNAPTNTGFIQIQGNRIQTIDSGIYLYSTRGMISNNWIYTDGGDGIFIHDSTRYHIIQDNEVQNKGRITSPWIPGSGIHCINIPQTGSAAGCYVKGNRLWLDAHDTGNSNTLPKQSACLRVTDVGWVHVCDNFFETQVQSVDASITPATIAYEQCWAVYIRASAGGYKNNNINVSNNEFEDSLFAVVGPDVQSVIGGLAIDVQPGWDSSSDKIKAVVKCNTFNSSLSSSGTYANDEATDKDLAAANFPYTVYVSEFFDTGPNDAGTRSNVFNYRMSAHFAGNSIHNEEGLGARQVVKVFLPNCHYFPIFGANADFPLGRGGICIWSAPDMYKSGTTAEDLIEDIWLRQGTTCDNYALWHTRSDDDDLEALDFTWMF